MFLKSVFQPFEYLFFENSCLDPYLIFKIISLFFLICNFFSSLYILEGNPLLDAKLVKIFCPFSSLLTYLNDGVLCQIEAFRFL